ncbi:MAG: enoyl-CoA hydratase/isomerase family protein [Actinomycetia bacterium]|nr:enoyl-CoA hydratase/isomerase family protein [Actinomycetes bacterium]
MTDEQTVLCDRNGGLATVTMNRPEQRNGITGRMMRQLHATLTGLAADESVQVVVLTGAGRSFCVGADLKHYSSGAADEGSPPETFQISVLLHEMPAVTVAAINGAAAGAGMGWAAACDLRIAARSAVFNTAFLDVAVAGDMGGPWTLSHLLGGAKARELYFLPGKFDADEAYRVGLVTSVHDDEEFPTAVDAVGQRLAGAAPLALRGMKQNFVASEQIGFAEFIAVETERHQSITASEDCTEAFAAFVEKRTPRFKGR